MKFSKEFRASWKSARRALGYYLVREAWKHLPANPLFPLKLWRCNIVLAGFLFSRI